MSEKEYIVSLKRGVDASNFKAEMTQSTGDANIPARSVDVVNERLLSTRNTHYSLTDEEAEQLKNDSRVAGINIPPQDDDTTEIGLHAVQIGDFKKTTADSGNHLNWGMRRCIESTNVYGTSTNNPSGDYTYHLDGTGVDVVIQDTGIQADHPEFFDASGNSRVQQIDWYTASGLAGTQGSNHYSDSSGHGTHCTGTAAGLRYGWAKNARIYSVKVAGLASDSAISITDCFDVIKGWHNNKPIDPATGYKRPTIVNMSWGYGAYSHNVTNVVYRGTSVSSGWSGISRDTAHGIVGSYRHSTYGYRVVDRRTSVDTDVQEMIDAGIHVCCAAGNSYQKVDIPSGADYNNYFVSTTFGTCYYHRGGSPFDDEAMIVGNVDSNTHSGGLEQKAMSSENGPGVDIYAPGTNIISSNSTASSYASGTYPGNSNFKICTISGTSMASPQVCGVGALILQANPHMTPAELKNYFITNSVSNMLYSTGSDTDYNVSRSLKGGNNRFLYNTFSSQYKFRITNS